MYRNNNFKRPVIKFFMLTYLIFWVLFILTGGIIMLNGPKLIQNIMPIICSWSPSFAFLVLYKRLYPDLALREFLKEQFFSAVKIPVLVAIAFIYIIIFLANIFSYSIMTNIPISSVVTASSTVIILGFFNQLIRGPLGEELGWRGYALNELQKRFSPVFSAVIIGAVWGFWHTPLWFVASGYSGDKLIQYIALFMVCIISTSIIITAFYNLNRNLLIPIIIHQLFNFFISIIKLDTLQIFYFIAPVYLVFAVLLVIVNPKKVLHGMRK
ncbi:MAG: CPBP family intramembrane metalloprotease [Clostridia bacterium]|nr:CPBP family intramembrane metalloprotease [Clostridia bacterium]